MNNELKKEYIEALKEAEGILSDSDGTLNYKTAYASLSLIEKCRKSRDYKNVLRGTTEAIYVYLGTNLRKLWQDGSEADNWGLKKLHNFLAASKIPKDTIQEVTLEYLAKHEISGAKDFLKTLRNFGKGKKVFITTRSASIFAEPVKKYFEADGYIANETIFRGEFIDGFENVMKTPEERLEITKRELQKQGTEIKDCIFIGDSNPDLIFKPHVKVFMSSPKANEKMKEHADIHIDSYEDFKRQLINSY